MANKKTPSKKSVCPLCVNDCKQPPEAILISCPDFKEPRKNLALFDSKGHISARIEKKKKYK